MTKLNLEPSSLDELYAGKIVRGLSKDVAVPFVFNVLRPIELAEVLNISKSTCSNIRAGRRKLSDAHQKVLYDWYLEISELPTTYINGDLVIAQGNHDVQVTDENIRDIMHNVRTFAKELNSQMLEATGNAIREFKRETLSSLRNTPTINTGDEIELEQTTQIVSENETNVSKHYNDTITIKGEDVLIRELPEDYTFDGDQARVALMRNLTYVDETGYRELYDEHGQVTEMIKVFNDDEYDENGNHFNFDKVRSIRATR